MTTAFLHGGPGLADYCELVFKSEFPEAVFFSQKSPVGSIQEAIADISDRLRPIGDLVLIGHSWGGALALEYLRSGAPPPKALVLVSAPLSCLCNADFSLECQKLGLSHPTPEQIFLSEAELADDECRQLFPRIMSTFNPEALAALDPYLNSFDLRSTFKSLSIPTLVAFGSDDIRVPARVQREYAKILPGVEMAQIHGAGHFPFLRSSDRRELIKAIKQFLSGQGFSKTTKNPVSL